MQFYPHLLLPFIGLASSTCNHDNCARALMGVHHHGTTVTSDCSSFLDTTIVPPVSTTSVTITSVIDTTATIQPAKRQEIATIPAYAAGVCLDAAVYASACSCLGVTPATITAPIPLTTITVTSLTTEIATVTVPTTTSSHSFTYYSNSSSTSSAAPTSSISPHCKGQTCGNITTCSGNSSCYCFTSASNSSFCGYNAVCSGLTPCANDFDCAGRNSTGDICAVKTCCSAPSVARPGVCLKGVCGNRAASLKMSSLARRWMGDTAAGQRH
ncbi:hypothetical protein V8E51_002229 [Hyaloscypha variabilis]